MATITRTPMVDDDGSGTTGTVVNNSWKSELYDQIDAALALVSGGGWPGGQAGQLPFPATQIPSGGANVLDDYEEGIFTPTDGSGASLALTGTGNYVKIGQLICATFGILYPTNSNGNVAFITLGTLPVADGNAPGYGVALGFNDLGYALNAVIDPGTNKVNFRNATTNVQIKNSDLAGHTIRGTGTYRCNP